MKEETSIKKKIQLILAILSIILGFIMVFKGLSILF